MAKASNIYTPHDIDLEKIHIRNAPAQDFAREVEKIPYRGYEVEDISDGRKIVIAKPGGKTSYVGTGKEDFFVFIYDPIEQTVWQISHEQIYDDLKKKSQCKRTETIKILEAFEEVYNGKEPDDVLQKVDLITEPGENPEALLKAYKWIWGEEDVNYPPPCKGRALCWERLKDLLERLRREIDTK